MRAVVQRVSEASVRVADAEVASIKRGLVVLFCVEAVDTAAVAALFARKIAAMRIFADADGRMNLSLRDVGGMALVVSQFTLAGRWRRGNRPDFSLAADPALGRDLYERFCRSLEGEGVAVATGRFGAHMALSLVNDGPVTIWMASDDD
jgi:D-aminoacyl-tRNA deacylase